MDGPTNDEPNLGSPSPPPRPKSGRGGYRPGAGRKVDSKTKLRQVVKETASGGREADTAFVDGEISKHLPQILKNVKILADGGFVRRTTKLEPARFHQVEVVATVPDENGILQVVRDNRGNPVMVKVAMFPELPPDAMVPINVTEEVAAPDLRANELMLAYRLGRPRQAIEHTGANGGPIEHSVLDAFSRAYDDADEVGEPDDWNLDEPEPSATEVD